MGKFSRSILNSAVTRRGCALLLICACVLPGTTTHADPALVHWNESTRFDDWYVQGSAARLQRWKDIIVSGQHLDEAEKLRLANDFFNGARFVSDEYLYGVAYYWATPT
jgi:predicted transglutaminase-like cysteine proteinase